MFTGIERSPFDLAGVPALAVSGAISRSRYCLQKRLSQQTLLNPAPRPEQKIGVAATPINFVFEAPFVVSAGIAQNEEILCGWTATGR